MKEESELTLGQFFSVVKKSFKRAIIYILVSCIIVGGILVGVKLGTKHNDYTAEIDFFTADEHTEEKITKSKDAVVEKSVNFIGKPEIKESVKNSLTLDPHKVDEGYPYVYTVSLKKDKATNLSDDEYVKLTDVITKEYINTVETYIVPQYVYSDPTQILGIALELYKVCNEYSLYFNLLKNTNQSVAVYKDAQNNTIDSLIAELSAKMTDLILIQNEIIEKKVVNEGKTDDKELKAYLNLAKQQADNEVAKNTALISNLYAKEGEKIKSINPFNDYSAVMLANENTSNNIEQYLQALDGSGNYDETIANTVNGYKSDVDAILTKIGTFRSEVESKKYQLTNSKITVEARIDTQSAISTKVLIAILVAVAVVAFIVAYSQTYFKLKKEGKLKNSNTETENADTPKAE